MCNQLAGDLSRDYRVSSRTYNKGKEDFAIVNSKLHSGKILSDEHLEILKWYAQNQNPMKGKIGKDNPLYNKPRSKKIKNKISETKLKNPKMNGQYKGDYITPYGIFSSPKNLAEQLNISVDSIRKYCKQNNLKVNKLSIKYSIFTNKDLNKSFKDLGWGFQLH